MAKEKSKKCFNVCPNCGAADHNIEWGEKEWFDTQAEQTATCLKCGQEFKEVYAYTQTVWTPIKS
jgi:hypothetical protein